jgi:hypothetical protein
MRVKKMFWKTRAAGPGFRFVWVFLLSGFSFCPGFRFADCMNLRCAFRRIAKQLSAALRVRFAGWVERTIDTRSLVGNEHRRLN